MHKHSVLIEDLSCGGYENNQCPENSANLLISKKLLNQMLL